MCSILHLGDRKEEGAEKLMSSQGWGKGEGWEWGDSEEVEQNVPFLYFVFFSSF